MEVIINVVIIIKSKIWFVFFFMEKRKFDYIKYISKVWDMFFCLFIKN